MGFQPLPLVDVSLGVVGVGRVQKECGRVSVLMARDVWILSAALAVLLAWAVAF